MVVRRGRGLRLECLLSFFAQGARPLEALALRGRTCALLDHLRGLCGPSLCDRVLRNVIVHSPALCRFCVVHYTYTISMYYVLYYTIYYRERDLALF